MISFPNGVYRYAALILTVIAVGYAFLAGLHTVSDFDTGWQLATGRYVVQHHAIPSTDVFSYTAAGKEWIYPPFAGVLFYGIYSLAGYAGLSWLCALVCAGIVALILSPRTPLRALLAILAVPLIADRVSPRAELFTTLIFAAFLRELWNFRSGGSSRLWTLPLLMLLWVNLHPGFVLGFALIAAYLVIDGLELVLSPSPRPKAPAEAIIAFVGSIAARQRLRHAWPWLALTAAVTVINPWGTRLYPVVAWQIGANKDLYSAVIGEWSATPVTWRNMMQAFSLHNPFGNYWWLMLAALAAIAACFFAPSGAKGAPAAWRRNIGTALLLAAFAYASLRYLRLQGIFAIVTVIVAGAVLDGVLASPDDEQQPANGAFPSAFLPTVLAFLATVTLAAVSITLFRIADLASNRFYVIGSSTSLFGAGESWWFPERAAAFIERERLPGNLFHEYGLGGFVIFRLGPRYPDYVDGRAFPFSASLFTTQQTLAAEPPDSQAWQTEANERNINLLLFSLARFGGLGSVDLAAYCRSKTWQPVYLDEVSAVFLRNRPENRPLSDRLRINCFTEKFSPPASRAPADRFNFYSNAGAVLAVLGRNQEALEQLDRAQAIFPFDPNVYLTRAQLLAAQGDPAGAERNYRAALARKETDVAWYALGRLLAAEHRYPEAAVAIENSAKLSPRPFNNYKALAQVELLLGKPGRALSDFTRAEHASPFHGEWESLGNEFHAQIAQGRAEAWRQLGRLELAEQFQQSAVQRTPQDAGRWLKLAEIYQASGQPLLAQQARQQAEALTPAPRR